MYTGSHRRNMGIIQDPFGGCPMYTGSYRCNMGIIQDPFGGCLMYTWLFGRNMGIIQDPVGGCPMYGACTRCLHKYGFYRVSGVSLSGTAIHMVNH